MEELVIVCRDANEGASYANLTLGLNSSQFEIVTSLEDQKDLRSGIYLVHSFPDDIIEIKEALNSKDFNLIPSGSELINMCNEIMESTEYINQTMSDSLGRDAFTRGSERYLAIFTSRSFSEENGYKFEVIRYEHNKRFVAVPKSPKAICIVNLIKGVSLNRT